MLKNAAPERGEVDVNRPSPRCWPLDPSGAAASIAFFRPGRICARICRGIVADRVQFAAGSCLNLVMNGIDAMRAGGRSCPHIDHPVANWTTSATLSSMWPTSGVGLGRGGTGSVFFETFLHDEKPRGMGNGIGDQQVDH